jgi:probable rRNA maturation factor
MSVNFLAVKIYNRQRTEKINLRLLKKIACEIFVQLKIKNADLEIVFVGAKKMAEINWQFLQHKGSTDVITFDYSNLKFKIPNSKFFLCGELFICVDEAILQSHKFKTTWQSEIVRYLVHGILHLIGHDDSKQMVRRKMKRAENFLLHKLSKKFSLAQIGGDSKLRA